MGYTKIKTLGGMNPDKVTNVALLLWMEKELMILKGVSWAICIVRRMLQLLTWKFYMSIRVYSWNSSPQDEMAAVRTQMARSTGTEHFKCWQ